MLAAEPHLAIVGVAKSFGGPNVVDDVSLQLTRGEFVTLLGDSGCGKTTLLRIVAGFTQPDRGRILLKGGDVTDAAPARRRMGFVFQSYALFPTKNVAQNIGFALAMLAKPRAEIGKRVRDLGKMFEIEALLQRYPHQLSGGQQQRVALARALASDPEVLLLDEPMSALDARIRVRLRSEVRSLVDRLGITTLYVTHDQEEALVLSDRVAILRQGRIEQIGRPFDIYHRPKTQFVAQFVGASNLIKGRAGQSGIEAQGEVWPMPPGSPVWPGNQVTALYRPEHLEVSANGQEGLPGRIAGVTFLGSLVRLDIAMVSGRHVIADRPSLEARDGFAVGMPVKVRADPRNAVILSDEFV
jgi:putative spermidine/putrescine transport system ATP-binding protein